MMRNARRCKELKGNGRVCKELQQPQQEVSVNRRICQELEGNAEKCLEMLGTTGEKQGMARNCKEKKEMLWSCCGAAPGRSASPSGLGDHTIPPRGGGVCPRTARRHICTYMYP